MRRATQLEEKEVLGKSKRTMIQMIRTVPEAGLGPKSVPVLRRGWAAENGGHSQGLARGCWGPNPGFAELTPSPPSSLALYESGTGEGPIRAIQAGTICNGWSGAHARLQCDAMAGWRISRTC